MLFLFLLYGILIGSFLNVLILRIPLKEEFVKTRSHCPKCQYQLKWYDLIPILSYIALRGRCRKCQVSISPQYPLIELLNGVAYLGIYKYMGLSITTILTCIAFSILLVIFIIDIRYMIIPNGLVVALFILAVIETIVMRAYLQNIIGFFAVSVFLLVLLIITRGGLGFGDVKLMAVAGLLIGWQKIILALMIGSIVGSLIGIGLLVFKITKRKEPIPFAPFLTVGIMLAMLFGDSIITWYLAQMIY